MTTYEPELSNLSILGISAVFALGGLLTYELVTAIPPAKLVELAHSAINQTFTR
jgi:hypothetical protein